MSLEQFKQSLLSQFQAFDAQCQVFSLQHGAMDDLLEKR